MVIVGMLVLSRIQMKIILSIFLSLCVYVCVFLGPNVIEDGTCVRGRLFGGCPFPGGAPVWWWSSGTPLLDESQARCLTIKGRL